MPLTPINVGTTANDNTGDTVRAAFQLCNTAFAQVDTNATNIAAKAPLANPIFTGTVTVPAYLYLGGGIIADVGAGQYLVGSHYLAAFAMCARNAIRISSDAFGAGIQVTLSFGDADHQLHVRSGGVANQLAVYNDYTSATNYERGVFDWQTTTNVLRVGTEKGSGGGTARAMSLVTDGTVRLTIKASGVINGQLPTSSAGLSSGDWWNDGGTVKIIP